MKQIEKLRNRLRGLTDAISRFPLTVAFLLVAAGINTTAINTEDSDYLKYLLTLVIGAFLGAVVQTVYERYFNKSTTRAILMGGVTLLTIGYYLIIMSVPKLSMEIGIRTAVALFALLIAFIWVPAIKSKISFNESFMVAFKAFFITLFFAGVIYGGISIIILAVDQLLFNVDYKSYSHTANIVFIIFAPMYFLSLIPVYPGERDKNSGKEIIEQQDNLVNKMANCPKYLEILISYIIIPLTAIFTIILILYIILNIGDKFWSNNLLEPMIVSYSITVILVYILASRLQNKFSELFRIIFPKVLIPIVLFQTISSIIRIGDMGITHTRYYVILYCIFATAAGIVFSIKPVQKNGIVAAMLIGFSIISILPPVDAFTISRISQINLLESVLLKNNMLEDNIIKPNSLISEDDKQKIIKSVNYLGMMEYTNKTPWLPANFNYYEDFYKAFGFYQYDEPDDKNQYVNVNLPQGTLIDIAGYDYMVFTNIYKSDKDVIDEVMIGEIDKSGKIYTLTKNISKDQNDIKLVDENKQEILSFSMKEIFDKFENFHTDNGMISADEATFTIENDQATIALVIQNLNMDNKVDKEYYGADFYVLVKIK